MMRDITASAGLAMLGTGTAFRFGWDIALIICGAVVLAFVLAGALTK